jgi:hypothetical protein
MAIAGAARADDGGGKASASGMAHSAARKTAGATRQRGRVRKALETMRFTARDCTMACLTPADGAGFGRWQYGFCAAAAVKSMPAASSRPLILRRNCGIGPGHGVAVICAD